MNLRDGEPAPQVPDAVRSKLTRRLVSLITLLITLSMVYAAAWAPPTDTVHVASVNASASNYLQSAFGAHVDIAFQMIIVFGIATFLSMLAPGTNDLDSKDMRRFVIGPMTVLSSVGATFVAIANVRALTNSRVGAAQTSHDQRVCLIIHYALVAFYYLWGAIYPNVVLFFLRNSWVRLRLGLTIDAVVFLAGFAVLWAHGEKRYPPGDAPLLAALLGRPAVGLLCATIFGPQTRQRIADLGAAAGLFHVQLGLKELRRHEIRVLLGRTGVDQPVAAGNEPTTVESESALAEERLVAVGDEYTTTSYLSSDQPASHDPSHHTAKCDAPLFSATAPGATADEASGSGEASGASARPSGLRERRGRPAASL